MPKNTLTRWPFFCVATLVVGVVSGLGGMFLALLLHFIQHVAFQHTLFPILGNEKFLYEVSDATVQRRVISLLCCGLIAGFGWWAVFRYGRPLVSISKAIASPRPYMPVGTTIAHVLLQIITVGLGSPLGREVAPRELCATFACWFTSKLKLHPKESQILVACAAGAGLAAVYNIPFGGALFTLEVLLRSFKWIAVVPAMATAATAVVISWIGLGNESLYHIPAMALTYPLVIWSIISGPIFGFAAYWFKEVINRAQNAAPRHGMITVSCFFNFLIIGLLAIYFPEILGNGRSAVQLGFDGNLLGIGIAFILLMLRVVIVCTSVWAGAWGGLLTPSLANGALMALVMGIPWSYLWPDLSMSSFAVVGAAAFLAAAQNMPITSIVLIVEFTGIDFSFFIPLLFAVGGSISMFKFCANRRVRVA